MFVSVDENTYLRDNSLMVDKKNAGRLLSRPAFYKTMLSYNQSLCETL